MPQVQKQKGLRAEGRYLRRRPEEFQEDHDGSEDYH